MEGCTIGKDCKGPIVRAANQLGLFIKGDLLAVMKKFYRDENLCLKSTDRPLRKTSHILGLIVKRTCLE